MEKTNKVRVQNLTFLLKVFECLGTISHVYNMVTYTSCLLFDFLNYLNRYLDVEIGEC